MIRPPIVWMNYRPVRIGWIVTNRDIGQLRKAVQQACCLWGGRFQPLIPADDLPLARSLIKCFGVDILLPVQESEEAAKLIEEFSHLRARLWGRQVFDNFYDGATFVDIFHPAVRMRDNSLKLPPEKRTAVVRPICAPGDPLEALSDIIFGSYPPDGIGSNYADLFDRLLSASSVNILAEDSLSPEFMEQITPIELSSSRLYPRSSVGRSHWGVVAGDCNNFDDLMSLWNLRAADEPVLFYDPTQKSRLLPMLQRFVELYRSSEPRDSDFFTIWGDAEIEDLDFEGINISRARKLGGLLWNGMNITPPTMTFNQIHHESIATVHSTETGVDINLTVPHQPFDTDHPLSRKQYFMVEVLTRNVADPRDDLVFSLPHLPRLNEFYGRSLTHQMDAVRSVIGSHGELGVAVAKQVGVQQIKFSAVPVRNLVKEFFALHKLSAEPSEPGLRCSRLINQLGGVQGCRVLKIKGARSLIRAYNPDQSFTRSGAITAIRDADSTTGRVGFEDFESLYIEQREHSPLRPEDVLNYLVTRGVFRVGLQLKCPNCILDSWVHLDDVRTELPCDYCGFKFHIAPQLKDRDWRYRRSGLFGRNDDQLGAIPVALTIQQLSTALQDRALMYTTGLNLKSESAGIPACEIDFFMLVSGSIWTGKKLTQAVFGECKTSGNIDAKDFDNLKRIADLIDTEETQSYIVLAKTAKFTEDEICRARKLNGEYRERVILLSADELEPYFMYERSEERLQDNAYATSLSDMAAATRKLYFDGIPE